MKTDHPFAEFPPTVENHFWLMRRAAIFRLIVYLRGLAGDAGEDADSCLEPYPFLNDYFEEMRPCLPDELRWEDALAWWERELWTWEYEASSRRPLPLRRLAEQAAFSFYDRLALLTIGLVEDDLRFGALFAALHDPLPSRRISQGLLESLYETDAPGVVSRLLDCGLIRAENRDAPRAETILRIPAPLWETLRGVTPRQIGGLRFRPLGSAPPLKRLILAPEIREPLLRLPALLTAGQVSGVLLRGMTDSGHRTVLASLARTLRRDLLTWERPDSQETQAEEFALMGPLCLLTGAFPALTLAPAPGETIELDRLTGYNGPVGVLLPREGGCSGPLVERALLFSLPSPTYEERLQLWQRLISPQTRTDVETLAARFRLPLGAIAQVVRIAATYAALDKRKDLRPEDVQQASRALNRQALDLLAQRLDGDLDEHAASTRNEFSRNGAQEEERTKRLWRRLVVSPATSAELRDIEHRCRYREQLRPHLGMAFPRTLNSGVRALFQGPSGTGKTLAARTLAALLQMDIYRVDLAAIVNKYVGETEKNLSRLLARAEELDVILLLDEGDSLLSGRTEVRSANDRYANLETNYLLQRLESYEGIVFVTTNTGGRIDTAFERRFDAVVRFSLPDARERFYLWKIHLPESELLSALFLEERAIACTLTGGQIRNAALHAALLAASEHRTVTPDDVDIAIRREYRKAGVASPLLEGPPATSFDPIAAFLKVSK